MLKQPFCYWQNTICTDETNIRLSSDGIVRVFRRNRTRFLKKNTKSFCSDKLSLELWGSIQSDGQKMFVKYPNKLNAAGYFKIVKNYDEKNAFSGHYFSTR